MMRSWKNISSNQKTPIIIFAVNKLLLSETFHRDLVELLHRLLEKLLSLQDCTERLPGSAVLSAQWQQEHIESV